jgi:hypothetical protein
MPRALDNILGCRLCLHRAFIIAFSRIYAMYILCAANRINISGKSSTVFQTVDSVRHRIRQQLDQNSRRLSSYNTEEDISQVREPTTK